MTNLTKKQSCMRVNLKEVASFRECTYTYFIKRSVILYSVWLRGVMYGKEKVTIPKDKKVLLVLFSGWWFIRPLNFLTAGDFLRYRTGSFLYWTIVWSVLMKNYTFVNLSLGFKDKFSLEASIQALSRMMLPHERSGDSTNKTKPSSGKNISYTRTRKQP